MHICGLGYEDRTFALPFLLQSCLQYEHCQIVAAMGSYVASWALSGIQEDTWRVHSTLKLPSDHIVTALHNKSGTCIVILCFPFANALVGLLAVGTNHSLSVYTLILDNDLPTWSRKWIVSCVSSFFTYLIYLILR